MPVVEKNMNPDEGLDDILKVVVKDLNLVNDNTPSGLVTNSILFCCLFTIKDRCKKCIFNKRTIKVCASCC